MAVSSSTPRTSDRLANEDLQDLFDRHYNRFLASRKGDQVKFKRPKRSPTWTIIDVETNIHRITWTQGGSRPNYIKVQLREKDKEGKECIRECWTCENQLIFLGSSS